MGIYDNATRRLSWGGTILLMSIMASVSLLGGWARAAQSYETSGNERKVLSRVDPDYPDALSNRAPVTVRLIPAVDDVSLDASDGTLLRRSQVALFTGLARRPPSGDRWGDVSPSDNNPDPAGGDPYTPLPPDLSGS